MMLMMVAIKRKHRPHNTDGANVGMIYRSSSALFLLLITLLLLMRGCESQSDINEDIQQCYFNLAISDTDRDGRIDSEEYVKFVKLEGPSEFLVGITSFIDLPLPLQSNFYTLACLCTESSSDGGNECCLGSNAHLDTTGAVPGDTATEEQAAYLEFVCRFTASAINVVLEEEKTPTPTTAPVPNQTPTILPTTEEPSSFPTNNSTDTMSPSPSFRPSSSLAPDPTMEPTMEPTIGSTEEPTFTAPKTDSPTVAPSSVVPVPIIVRTVYNIIVPNGLVEDIPQSSYTPDLISAMNVVSQDVGATLVIPGVDERRRDRRHLGHIVGMSHSRIANHDDGLSRRFILNERSNTIHGVTRQLRTNKDRSEEPTDRILQRQLEVLIILPTIIEGIEDQGFTDTPLLVNGAFVIGPCPNDFGDVTTDLCQEVTVSVPLEITEGEDAIAVYGAFLLSLNEALRNGAMGDALVDVAPNSVVSVATGKLITEGPEPETDPPVDPSEDDGGGGLSTPAIAGIAVGGTLFLLVVSYVAVQNGGEDPNKQGRRWKFGRGGVGAVDGSNDAGETLKAIPVSETLELDKQAAVTTSTKGTDVEAAKEASSSPEGHDVQYNVPPMEDDEPSVLLAAAVPYISSNKSDEKQPAKREVEFSNEHELGMLNDSTASVDARSTGGISHESDAGWSETYTSNSIGTMSDDEMIPETPGPEGAGNALTQPNLVMLGTANALSVGPTDTGVAATDAKLEDLENAIIEGNWIAVGATAAALSAMHNDNLTKSDMSKSTGVSSAVSSMMSDKWKESIDFDKAAELDRLIELGDWEGIIQAASRFENEKSGMPIDSFVRAITGGGSPLNEETEVHDDIVHEDNSDDDEGSSSPMKAVGQTFVARGGAKISQDEFRSKVLDLVKEVVPEEVDNVDEMIEQFKGREADLLDTLNAMQSRASAFAKLRSD
jgi:hypothetical protein